MLPHGTTVLDLRSLAAFRILLSLYLLWDIYSRFFQYDPYDSAWYTSDPPHQSFLPVHDTPHKAPLHRFWFYRGNVFEQAMLMAFTFGLLLLQTFGCTWQHPTVVSVLIWILVTSYQNRNMHVHDGSDSFVRHLLLWSISLPITNVWSVDSWKRRKQQEYERRRNRNTKTSKQSTTKANDEMTMAVRGLPCLALTLQIALMYWGTVAHRTVDLYPLRDTSSDATSCWYCLWPRSEWMPPNLTAVHYAIAGSFATRDNVLTRLIISTPWISKSMTVMAMVGETFLPLACLLDYQRRHLYGILLWKLHFGLFLTLNLPSWQLVGMLTQVLWIPTHVWDRLEAWWEGTNTDPVAVYKKTDADDRKEIYITKAQPNVSIKTLHPRNPVTAFLQLFWFVYMIYNWLGCRRWIPKHDNGDIGEGLRLSQYWVMYQTVSHVSQVHRLSGLVRQNETVPLDGTESEENVERLDLFKFVKTGKFQSQEPLDVIITDMSSRYPSPRWERAFTTWSSDDTIRHFCQTMCYFVNRDRRKRGMEPILSIELRTQMLIIQPPGSEERYWIKDQSTDSVLAVECN